MKHVYQKQQNVEYPFRSISNSPDALPNDTTLRDGTYVIENTIGQNKFGLEYQAHTLAGLPCFIQECYIQEACSRNENGTIRLLKEYSNDFHNLIFEFKTSLGSLLELKKLGIGSGFVFFEENNTIYLVFQKYDGHTLQDIVAENYVKPTPIQTEVMLVEALKALSLIHKRGILHRNIEPRNIVLSASNELTLLIDFCTFSGDGQKDLNRIFEIASYNSPYQSLEIVVDQKFQSPASDVYSLAACFYFLISGRPPIAGEQRILDVTLKHTDPYIPLVGNVVGYPIGFLQTIDLSLNALSEDRIISTNEWLKRLDQYTNKADIESNSLRKEHLPDQNDSIMSKLKTLVAPSLCLIFITIFNYFTLQFK
jgi:serine/threonine protein kinase